MVTPSSIPSSATQGPNADLSFKDEPIMKTRNFYFNEDGDGGGQKAKAIGICLSSLADLLFLFFLSFPSTFLWLLYISFFAATDIPKEPKTVAGLAMPIAPSAIPVAPTPWVLVIFFPLCFLQLRLSSLYPFLHFVYSLQTHVVPRISFQV